MRLDLARLRFHLTACDSICFPEGQSANILRGALGMHLRGELFRPTRTATGPSGLADPPRPFVFRTRAIEGRTFRPGDAFSFDLHIFTIGPVDRTEFIRSIGAAAAEGLGPGRGRADLNPSDVAAELISLDLAPRAPLITAPPRIRIEFLTPTELKHNGAIATGPEFPILFCRIRDRVATIQALYGASPLEIDFMAIGQRAESVRPTNFELRHVGSSRRSSRTSQEHAIGGFTGTAEYEGPLAEFLPWIEAARWTGVGRQAVWGKGEIAIVHAGPRTARNFCEPAALPRVIPDSG